ncbi:polysaccharide deacetylase family protein [Saccharothrix violaceirubra]|uniref:Peptidoglycan/xylan/chitin deacetylase (PgdA/CDA1 family) n=1 Tax=Saccharothrix violaceirubra TaxID=413306 RepID=A0A7W7T0D3_9PSEU|nr:polysaccharide deacetylase family protein [Saccharothrix violaceirubra]MBB4963986.1 peptidoglycan/xylan/chitin deacetylase (PgdA/CDA1 family) [Saccharothrix violaceirubra]
MRRIRVIVAIALVSVTVACGAGALESQPVAAPTTTTSSVPPTTTTPPTALPGPNGTTVPVFQPAYAYGTPQASAPPAVDGLAPIVRRIETDKPYVFITIDDGAVRHPAALELIRLSGVRPTLFLNTKHVEGDVPYFRAFQDRAGARVHGHTTDHPNLQGQGYAFQHREICENTDYIGAQMGKRPTLFRPPFGNYDQTTRKAAADCGIAALVLWTAAVNDGVVQFQAGGKLNPGDIVLMHFRQTFVEDWLAFLNRAKQDGLTPVLLDDFLSPTAPPA